MRAKVLLAVGVLLVPATISIAGASPEDKCLAGKHKASGGYDLCVRKAVAKAVKSGGSLDVAGCSTAVSGAWDKAEAKGEGACPDVITDTADFATYLAAWATSSSAIIAGSAQVPVCGDDDVNRVGELCDGTDLDGTACTSLGYASGNLACNGTCTFDTTGCLE